MSNLRLLRLFCFALVGGFLTGAPVVLLLHWCRVLVVSRSAIVLAEVSS